MVYLLATSWEESATGAPASFATTGGCGKSGFMGDPGQFSLIILLPEDWRNSVGAFAASLTEITDSTDVIGGAVSNTGSGWFG